MSGAASRARRTNAIARAERDVYRANGGEMGDNPFTDPRQARIYAKAYAERRAHYWRMEALVEEMEAVYGSIGRRA